LASLAEVHWAKDAWSDTPCTSVADVSEWRDWETLGKATRPDGILDLDCDVARGIAVALDMLTNEEVESE
jgi:hypothetical protein